MTKLETLLAHFEAMRREQDWYCEAEWERKARAEIKAMAEVARRSLGQKFRYLAVRVAALRKG